MDCKELRWIAQPAPYLPDEVLHVYLGRNIKLAQPFQVQAVLCRAFMGPELETPGPSVGPESMTEAYVGQVQGAEADLGKNGFPRFSFAICRYFVGS